ncbi:coiled-coil-helix-coiled-coil-helix domain-containing protein 10, mitochondrial-like [Drosophila subobscura]|uniref:coiled-coil-helix-coiled-coil-helix domain-containing protein 10, mitochondrial-like n=1 Tax=Drosophila subobscura TaxID=7241 RepID=UPI00155B19F9|nr:coiled-coil-helix-coiled-coil-helix domain-containing protein 10, mitochondrial-like [Drosophila subobscura]
MPRQRSDKSSGSARHQSSRSNTSCTIPVPKSRASNSQLPAVNQPPKQQSTPAPATKAAATAPAAEVAPKESGKGSLFKDMAATAAGVAAGSAVGHVVGAGITSLFGGGGGNSVPAIQPAEQAAPPVAVQAQRTSELVDDAPCAYELRQFLKCTEENSDLTACQGFNEAMKECRRRYNI